MRIVFEGTDLVGKSTLAKRLAEDLGVPYRGKIVRVGQDKVKSAQKADFAENENAVLDRCYWLSDAVYEPIVAGAISACSHVDYVKQMCSDTETLYVHILASEEEVRTRFEERGDDIQSLGTILAARVGYLRLLEVHTPVNYICIDTTKKTADQSYDALYSAVAKFLGLPQKVVKAEGKHK